MRSMTGYGSAEYHSEDIDIKVEIKSLNGKFLELNLRTPKNLGEREVELRQYLSKKLVRGSVLCTVTLDIKNSTSTVRLNDQLASAYYKELYNLALRLEANDKDIFRTAVMMPDVMNAEDAAIDDAMWLKVISCCEDAFAKFDDFRQNEGESLRAMLKAHNHAIQSALPKIEPLEAERKSAVFEKLKAGLEDLQDVGSDANRFEQELIYYLEKLDISEEKNRLSAHCELFSQELNSAGNGKKLGFISQEMGREINTLGSKASYAPIQEIVIGMKEELEKIKEQTLNVL